MSWDPAQITLSVQARANDDDQPWERSRCSSRSSRPARHLILMLYYRYPEGLVARLADEVVGKFG